MALGWLGPWKARVWIVTAVASAVWAGSSAPAQQPGCGIPVNVVLPAPDLSAMPKARADDAVESWNRLKLAMHYEHWEWAQRQPSGFASGPFGVIAPAEAGYPTLEAQDFFAHDHKHSIRVRSITVNSSPRRIVFVVENGKRITPALRTAGAAIIAGTLSNIRPEDSFGLITAGGPRVELPLGSTPESIQKAFVETTAATSTAVQGEDILDATFEATAWLAPPQPGDAIFIVARDPEGKHHVAFSKVRDAVAAGRIRVFEAQLGEGPPGADLGGLNSDDLANIPGGGIGNVNHLALIGKSSGGLALVTLPPAPRDPQSLSQGAGRIYHAICVYYDMQLDSAGKDLIVGLVPTVQDRFPWAFVSYPRDPAPCRAP